MKKMLSITLVLAMLLSLLCSCAGGTTSTSPEVVAETVSPAAEEEGVKSPSQNMAIQMPLSDEPVHLSYYMRFNPQISDWVQDFSDNYFYKTLEEISNVVVDFQLMHPSIFGEQFNLQIASGAYADIYCEAGSGYVGGYDQAVDDNVFLDLSELIEEYAPNYWAILNESDDVMRSGTTDKSRIVFVAQVYEPYAPCICGPQIRADWAEALGFDPAEISTYTEYEEYIVSANNEYGATVQLHNSGTANFNYLVAGFGVTSSFGSSFEATLPFYQVDGVVKFAPLEDGFREYVELVSDWYSRGLIYADFYSLDSSRTGGADVALVTTGDSSLWWAEHYYMTQYKDAATDPGFAVAAIQDAVKNKGDKTHFAQTNYERLTPSSACVITSACEIPEIALSWLDYRFSEEGALLANWGVEGETYEIVNGEPVFTDLIVNNPEGMTATLAQFRYMLQNTVCLTSVAAQQQGLNEQQLEAVDIWMTDKDGAYSIPVAVTLTQSEAEELANITSDISTYCQENFLKFLTNERPVSEISDFVQDIENMDIARAIAINQTALDRYYSR